MFGDVAYLSFACLIVNLFRCACLYVWVRVFFCVFGSVACVCVLFCLLVVGWLAWVFVNSCVCA